MPLASGVGKALYYRGKGIPWVEMFRPWIVPMVFSGAGAKYLGMSTGVAVALAITIPVVIEGVAIVLGLLEHRSGATEVHYRVAAETDVFKRDSLALLREIRDLLGQQTLRVGDRLALMDRSVRIVRIEPRPGGAKAIFAQPVK